MVDMVVFDKQYLSNQMCELLEKQENFRGLKLRETQNVDFSVMLP